VRVIRCDARVPGAIADLARREAPRECCGLLLGTATAIAEAVGVTNISPDVNRFELDPAGHIRVRREARDRGLTVVGVFHSHVRVAAVPSARDLAEASYPEYLCGILSLQAEVPAFRLFELRPEGFDEVAIAY
jgi:proteasome lid subunit RPN8/RPN11